MDMHALIYTNEVLNYQFVHRKISILTFGTNHVNYLALFLADFPVSKDEKSLSVLMEILCTFVRGFPCTASTTQYFGSRSAFTCRTELFSLKMMCTF